MLLKGMDVDRKGIHSTYSFSIFFVHIELR
jgi:hypothetical protein